MHRLVSTRRSRPLLTGLAVATTALALAACTPQEAPADESSPAAVVPAALTAISDASDTRKVQQVDVVMDHDDTEVTAVMVAEGRATTWTWEQGAAEVHRSPDDERATSGPRFWITAASMSEAFIDVPSCAADRATWHGLALGGFIEPQLEAHCGAQPSASHWYAIGGEQIDPAAADLTDPESLAAEVQRGRQLLVDYDVAEVQVQLDESVTLLMTGAGPAPRMDGSEQGCWPQYAVTIGTPAPSWDLRCVSAPSVWGLATVFDAQRALDLYDRVLSNDEAAGPATAVVLSYSTENDEPVYTVRLATGTLRTFDAEGAALT